MGITERSSVQPIAGVPGNAPMSGGRDIHRWVPISLSDDRLQTGHFTRKKFPHLPAAHAAVPERAEPPCGTSPWTIRTGGKTRRIPYPNRFDWIGQNVDRGSGPPPPSRDCADPPSASRAARSPRERPRLRSPPHRSLPTAARRPAPPARDCVRQAPGDGRVCVRGRAAREKLPYATRSEE